MIELFQININQANKYGQTAFIYACSFNYIKLVDLLFKNKSNVEISDKKGNTGFLKACENNHLVLVQKLL